MNKVELIGRLTKDPELKYTKSNIPIASYTVAINSNYGEKQQTDYINIKSWGKSGEFVSNYFKKGQQIAIVGRLKNNNYEDKDGNKRYTTEVITENIDLIGDKKQEKPQEGPKPEKKKSTNDEWFTLDDDDLPF